MAADVAGSHYQVGGHHRCSLGRPGTHGAARVLLGCGDSLSDREKANVWKRFAAARSDGNEDLPARSKGRYLPQLKKAVLVTPRSRPPDRPSDHEAAAAIAGETRKALDALRTAALYQEGYIRLGLVRE
jgi:hypothetical protein